MKKLWCKECVRCIPCAMTPATLPPQAFLKTGLIRRSGESGSCLKLRGTKYADGCFPAYRKSREGQFVRFKENGLAYCQPSSVLCTVAFALGCNGERTVRNCHCIIADIAGCVCQRGHDGICPRLTAGCCRAVLGCGNGITVLDSRNRSGEGGIWLSSGARGVISNNAQRRRCNRQSAGVDYHRIVAQPVVWVNQGSNDRVIAYRTAGI